MAKTSRELKDVQGQVAGGWIKGWVVLQRLPDKAAGLETKGTQVTSRAVSCMAQALPLTSCSLPSRSLGEVIQLPSLTQHLRAAPSLPTPLHRGTRHVDSGPAPRQSWLAQGV